MPLTPTPTPAGAAEAERRQAMREKDAHDYERWQSFLETTLRNQEPEPREEIERLAWAEEEPLWEGNGEG